MHTRFEYADKSNLQPLMPQLFSLLHANMSKIAPTGKTYEEDYAEWFSNVYPAMQRPQRQIVLMYRDAHLCGYFQYYVNEGTFMMEEIQIDKAYHSTGIFSGFFSWLLHVLPHKEIEIVEAYAHKENVKSQGILQHLGLTPVGENKNGSCYRYRGEYRTLLRKYS